MTAWASNSQRSPVSAERRVNKLERHYPVKSLQELVESTIDHDYVRVLSAHEGRNVGRVLVYRAGTGTPSVVSDRFADLASGTLCNAAGVNYKIVGDEIVTPMTFGAIADGAHPDEDTAGWQHVVDYATASGLDVRWEIYAPRGTYDINENIKFPLNGLGDTVAQKIVIRGAGKWNRGTTLKAVDAACSKVLEFATAAESASHNDVALHLETIAIDGNNIAAYGVHGAALAHASMERTFIQQCTDAGAYIGASDAGGYCNRFSDAIFRGNGIGLVLGGAPNNNEFSGVKFWLNGIGVDIRGGWANNLRGCLFEGNTQLAGRLQGSSILIDGCYCENNSATGYGMTTPALTMHADFYIKGGSSDTALEIYAPSENVEIRNSFTQAGDSVNGCFVYVAAVDGLKLHNNNCKSNAQIPLLRTRFNNSYSLLRKVDCTLNKNFSKDIDLDGFTSTILPVSGRRIDWFKSDSVFSRNYAVLDFSAWTFDGALGGNGGTWSTVTDKFRGMPVYELAHAASTLTNYARFSLAAADYPDLHGKRVAFSMAVKASGAGTLVFTPTDFTAQAALPNADWEFRTAIFDFPAGGTVNVGFAFTGLNGNVKVASPILYEVGADAKLLMSQIH